MVNGVCSSPHLALAIECQRIEYVKDISNHR